MQSQDACAWQASKKKMTLGCGYADKVALWFYFYFWQKSIVFPLCQQNGVIILPHWNRSWNVNEMGFCLMRFSFSSVRCWLVKKSSGTSWKRNGKRKPQNCVWSVHSAKCVMPPEKCSFRGCSCSLLLGLQTGTGLTGLFYLKLSLVLHCTVKVCSTCPPKALQMNFAQHGDKFQLLHSML